MLRTCQKISVHLYGYLGYTPWHTSTAPDTLTVSFTLSLTQDASLSWCCNCLYMYFISPFKSEMWKAVLRGIPGIILYISYTWYQCTCIRPGTRCSRIVIPLNKDKHSSWGHIKPVVRAIEVSRAACNDEFRRNPRSHSSRFSFYNSVCGSTF